MFVCEMQKECDGVVMKSVCVHQQAHSTADPHIAVGKPSRVKVLPDAAYCTTKPDASRSVQAEAHHSTMLMSKHATKAPGRPPEKSEFALQGIPFPRCKREVHDETLVPHPPRHNPGQSWPFKYLIMHYNVSWSQC